jgi:hypothetical protein
LTTYVFTSANLAYAPKVAALAESVKRHNPDVRFVWALVERPGVTHRIPRDVDEVLSLDMLEGDWLQALRGRLVVEACTAIKGAALCHLLARGDCSSAIYMDPDIYVYAPLTPVWKALRQSSIVLTPHMLSPSLTTEGIWDNEVSTLKHGIFNLGFIAVAADRRGRRFARWWDARLRTYCLDAPHLGLFTDQRWVDLAPIFFEGVHVLRHEGCNVASWNIGERPITERDGRLWAGRYPLVFWHFSSVDTDAHLAMIDRYAQNDLPRRISDQYRTALAACEAEYAWKDGWTLAVDAGTPPISSRRGLAVALVPIRLMSVGPLSRMARKIVPTAARRRIRRRLLSLAGHPLQ